MYAAILRSRFDSNQNATIISFLFHGAKEEQNYHELGVQIIYLYCFYYSSTDSTYL